MILIGQKHANPDIFALINDIKINVEAGEQARALKALLNKITAYKEKAESIKAKLKKLWYIQLLRLLSP